MHKQARLHSIASRHTRPGLTAAGSFLAVIMGTSLLGQEPLQKVDSSDLELALPSAIKHVVQHLEAIDETAAYACDYSCTRLVLASGQPELLKATPLEFLIPLLAKQGPAESVPREALTRGRAVYFHGKYVNFAHNQICGAPRTSLVYFDGVESLEFFEDQVVTMRRGASESSIVGLPWTLARFGAKRLAPMLRAAAESGLVMLEADAEGRQSLRFSLSPESSTEEAWLHEGWNAEVAIDVLPTTSERRIRAITIRNSARLHSQAVFLEFDREQPLWPTLCDFTLLLPVLGPEQEVRVTHSMRMSYHAPCIDPREVLVAATKAIELRGNNDVLLPIGGIDESLSASATAIAESSGAPSSKWASLPSSHRLTEPKACDWSALSWPTVSVWLQDSMRAGLIQTRDAAAGSMCLQVACVMVAKTRGVSARFDDVAKRWPQARITIEEGLKILQHYDLQYSAIEVDTRDLLKCRQAFIIIDPTQEVAHATAAKVRGDALFQLRGARRLVSQSTESVKSQAVLALIANEDLDALR